MSGEGLLVDGRSDAARTLILAHGAGQGMRSPFMASIAAHVADAGIRVVRFEFPYMVEAARTGRARPPDRPAVLERTWREVIEQVAGSARQTLVIGGKSLGGRIASQLVDAAGVGGLVCLGYPFHPPGKPDRLRIDHLETLRTPALICQGERDPFGTRAEVERYRLSAAVRLHWMPDGEHSFKPRKRAGLTWEDNLADAARAVVGFLERLPGSRA